MDLVRCLLGSLQYGSCLGHTCAFLNSPIFIGCAAPPPPVRFPLMASVSSPCLGDHLLSQVAAGCFSRTPAALPPSVDSVLWNWGPHLRSFLHQSPTVSTEAQLHMSQVFCGPFRVRDQGLHWKFRFCLQDTPPLRPCIAINKAKTQQQPTGLCFCFNSFFLIQHLCGDCELSYCFPGFWQSWQFLFELLMFLWRGSPQRCLLCHFADVSGQKPGIFKCCQQNMVLACRVRPRVKALRF